jgi:hypothetical protein
MRFRQRQWFDLFRQLFGQWNGGIATNLIQMLGFF